MGKPPTQVNEPYVSPNVDHDKDMADNGANPTASKAIYVAIALVMVILFLLVGVGLHLPTGG